MRGDARVGHSRPDLVGFTARKTGDAKRAAQAKTLIDLRVDPELGALPQPKTCIKGYVPGLAALIWIEAVLPAIRRSKWKSILVEVCGLPVQAEFVHVERGPLGAEIRIHGVRRSGS